MFGGILKFMCGVDIDNISRIHNIVVYRLNTDITIDSIPYGHGIGNNHRLHRTIHTRWHPTDVILSPIGANITQ